MRVSHSSTGLRCTQGLLIAIESPAQGDKASTKATYALHIECVGIHTLLVVLHLILIIIMNREIEKRVLIDIGAPTSRWSTGIQIMLQTFSIVSLIAV